MAAEPPIPPHPRNGLQLRVHLCGGMLRMGGDQPLLLADPCPVGSALLAGTVPLLVGVQLGVGLRNGERRQSVMEEGGLPCYR